MNLEKYAELFMERMFDVLWHNEYLKDSVNENDFEDILRKSVIFQLEMFKEDVKKGLIK